jgi:ribosomal protein L21E
VLSRARRGKGSLSKLSRSEGLSARTVRRATGAFRKRGGRWVATRTDRIQRWLKTYEAGQRREVLIDDSRTATLLSNYSNAVGEYLRTGNPEVLEPFEGITYRDASGVEHTFETDPQALRDAAERSEADFASFADLYSESSIEEETAT